MLKHDDVLYTKLDLLNPFHQKELDHMLGLLNETVKQDMKNDFHNECIAAILSLFITLLE